MIENFDKICRTCLEEVTNSKSLFNMCYINGEMLRLSEILTACTSIQVLENDNMPKKVCSKCENSILNTFRFQELCHNSDSVLKAVCKKNCLSQSLPEVDPPLEIKRLENIVEESNILNSNTAKQDQVNHLVKRAESSSLGSGSSDNIDFCEQEHSSYNCNEINEDHDVSQDIGIKSSDISCAHIQDQMNNLDEALKTQLTSVKILKEENDCERQFGDQDNIPYSCNTCGKLFIYDSSLIVFDSQIHSGEKPFVCTYCGKDCVSSSTLRRYTRTHIQGKPYHCNLCTKNRILEDRNGHAGKHRWRPYSVRTRQNPFEDFDVDDFFVRFRIKKETALFVLEHIEHTLEFPTHRNQSVSPINQLLLTLRFYATGGFLLSMGDTINVSKSSACAIIKRVTFAIASLSPQFIKIPTTEEERRTISQRFYDIAGMPRVLGSLDCTHVKIQSPGGDKAKAFRNKKGYYSINVQTISDTNLKIMDIVAKWPGSVHDQTIFDNSDIKHRFEAGEFENSLLVADNGYVNTMHVITPLLQTKNRAEELYNESVKKTRNPVERQHDVFKRRFPVLALGLRLKLETSLAVIVACAVLHNIAIDHKEDIPPHENALGDINYNENINVEPPEGDLLVNTRDILINTYSTNLQ